jgi:hypothetical protein
LVRILGWAALAVIVAVTLFVFAQKGTQAVQSAKGYKTYLGLRNLILTGSRTKFSLPATSRLTEPWGVVMDWGIKSGTVTVVAMSDGSASIYLSSGGGSLGGVGQEAIRNAAKRSVVLASTVQPEMKESKSFPLPQTGYVGFYALTDSGVFSEQVPEADLRAGRSPFSSLGNAMQEVITAYRIHEQSYQKPPS